MGLRARYRTYSLFFLFILSAIDLTISVIKPRYPYLANFLRPVVVMIFLSQIRQVAKTISGVMIDSLVVLVTIFAYIFFASFLAFYLFNGTFEGFTVFPTLGETYY